MAITRPSDNLQRSAHPRGFTLIELLVCIVILMILLSIMLPMLHLRRTASEQIQCQVNQRDIVFAMTAYSFDNKRLFPAHRNRAITHTWIDDVRDYVPGEDVVHCPVLDRPQNNFGVDWSWSPTPHDVGYGYNGFFLGHYWHQHTHDWSDGTYINTTPRFRFTSVIDPYQCIVMADSNPKIVNGSYRGVSLTLWWPYINRFKEGVSDRHDGSAVVAFVDGHTELVEDPDSNINPAQDNTDQFIEFWDPLQRKKP